MRDARPGSSPPPGPEVAALIPALNEEESLPGVLEALAREGVERVVVVDNASTDATAEVARRHGAEVVREERRGYGAACLAGIDHLARHAPPDILAFVDADQPVGPGGLEPILRPLLGERADLAMGVRTDPGGGVGTLQPHARLGNRLVLGLARLLFGRRFRDLGPFRAVRFELLRALEMDDRSWGWTLQMQLRAHLRGARIVEVDVPHRLREKGRSKITGSLTTSLRVGMKMFWTLVRERVRGW